jgi:hypothetical protein
MAWQSFSPGTQVLATFTDSSDAGTVDVLAQDAVAARGGFSGNDVAHRLTYSASSQGSVTTVVVAAVHSSRLGNDACDYSATAVTQSGLS